MRNHNTRDPGVHYADKLGKVRLATCMRRCRECFRTMPAVLLTNIKKRASGTLVATSQHAPGKRLHIGVAECRSQLYHIKRIEFTICSRSNISG
jgi:hypothetical protein